MLKMRFKRLAQAILGFDGYLFVFALFKIATLPHEHGGEADFNLFLARLPGDGIAVDAGANIGVMSALMARRMRRGTIHAFEPIPANYRALREVIGWLRLRNVTTYPVALGERDEEIEMVLPEQDRVKLQGFGHVVDAAIRGYPEGEHYRVACRRLDSIEALADGATKIAGIKIDVEGFEYFVLRGGEALIARDRPVIYCEISEIHRAETLAFFMAHGYQVMVAESGHLALYREDRHGTSWNLFAIPDQG